jgi:hypothetical protein
VLARSPAGGGVCRARRGAGHGAALRLRSDNRWNRFPLEPGFAPFIAETAQYLTRGARTASQFVLPDVPAAVPPMPGVHTRPAAAGQPASAVVVNIDPAESDPTAGTAEVFASRVRATGRADAPRLTDEARAREEQQRLWQLANHDSLTGLPNRMLLMDRLEQMMARMLRHEKRMAVLFPA